MWRIRDSLAPASLLHESPVIISTICLYTVKLVKPRAPPSLSSYKRVKGRSHTAEKRISMHPHIPRATSQPSRFSHTPRLSTDSAHNQHSH